MADEEKPAPATDEATATELAPVPPEEPTAAEVTPLRRKPERRGGFVAPFLGGVVAAAIGFGLSHYNVLGLRAEFDPASVTAGFDRLDQESKAATAAGKAAGDQAEAATKRAESGLAALTARLDELETKLAAQAETLPDGSIPPAAFAALKAEVETLRSAPAAALNADALRQQIDAELDARAAEIAAEAERQAEETRQTALRDAAWIALNEAVRTGQPYADALTALGLTDVPAPLASHTETGLPGIPALAESFPEAARTALEDSLRADEAGGFGDRALSLLRVTTGQRSLTPQEGSDPDAVLSRAEAAVKAGDLPAALSELQGLPPEGIAAMAAWSAQAQARIDAEAALAALKP